MDLDGQVEDMAESCQFREWPRRGDSVVGNDMRWSDLELIFGVCLMCRNSGLALPNVKWQAWTTIFSISFQPKSILYCIKVSAPVMVEPQDLVSWGCIVNRF